MRVVPFLDVSRLQREAFEFDPIKTSTDGKIVCKSVTEISVSSSPATDKSFYYWDFDFEQAIMLFALKMHRCQIDQPGVNTWDGYIGRPDSQEMLHPIAKAYYKIAYAIMESGGGALEYPVASYSMRWAEQNIKRIDRPEVFDEVGKICKILNSKIKDSDDLNLCKNNFSEASNE